MFVVVTHSAAQQNKYSVNVLVFFRFDCVALEDFFFFLTFHRLSLVIACDGEEQYIVYHLLVSRLMRMLDIVFFSWIYRNKGSKSIMPAIQAMRPIKTLFFFAPILFAFTLCDAIHFVYIFFFVSLLFGEKKISDENVIFVAVHTINTDTSELTKETLKTRRRKNKHDTIPSAFPHLGIDFSRFFFSFSISLSL